MLLINCEVTLDLNWSENWVIVSTNEEARATAFLITDTKIYVLVVTLSTQDNAKLLKQLTSGINIKQSITRKSKLIFRFFN